MFAVNDASTKSVTLLANCQTRLRKYGLLSCSRAFVGMQFIILMIRSLQCLRVTIIRICPFTSAEGREHDD